VPWKAAPSRTPPTAPSAAAPELAGGEDPPAAFGDIVLVALTGGLMTLFPRGDDPPG
jgi:hypothetical protein